MTTSLADKHILITGASRGIGRALALAVARDAPRLSVCGRDREALDSLASEAGEQGAAEVYADAFDLADAEATRGFIRTAQKRFGAVDILVNNAGCNSRKAPVHEVDLDEFDAMLAVNLRAPFVVIREALPGMIARGSGHILNVLSTVCLFDNETMSVYTAAKKGLQGLTDVLRKEVRPHGLRVTSVYPGGTHTTFRANARPDYMSAASVAEALRAALVAPEDLVVHELTFRPMVETNF